MERIFFICLALLALLSGFASHSLAFEGLSVDGVNAAFSTLTLRNETPIPKEAEKLLRQSTPCCEDFSSFPFQPMKFDSTQTIIMDGSFPSFTFTEGKSFFIAYRLPRSNRSFFIEIHSIAAPDRVFAPKVLILDSNYQITRQFGEEYFTYKPSGFLKGERLEANLEGIGENNDERFLVLYSPSARREGVTQLIHPAKQFARGNNTAEPDIADPAAKHSPLGTLTLYASTEQAQSLLPDFLQSTPEDKETPIDSQANQKIKKAVAEGRIEDAMLLVEEAEANGSGTARKTFIDSVRNKEE